MKKIVLTYGLIAGLLVSLFLVASMAWCYQSGSFEGNMFVGFSAMILAFSLIFVGIKKWRDDQNAGSLSFGQGFLIGLYISLIASTMYVVSWMVEFHFFMPDFMEKLTAHTLEQAKAAGATAAEITKKKSEMEPYEAMYRNPLMFALITYTEILPVGLVVSVVSAFILKKRPEVVS
jgi:hypothetical protein